MTQKMKKLMLVGKSGSGKTTLIQVLTGQDVRYRKTQAVDYCSSIIDTPGEYLENRGLFSALIALSVDSTTIALVQDASQEESLYPPLFAAMFSRRVIGIITKADLVDGEPEKAKEYLKQAGVRTILKSSSTKKSGLEEIKMLIEQE